MFVCVCGRVRLKGQSNLLRGYYVMLFNSAIRLFFFDIEATFDGALYFWNKNRFEYAVYNK